MAPLTPAQIKSAYDQALKLMTARRYDDALKPLQQIVAANPNIAEVHFQVGRLAIESNRPHLGLKPFQKAAALKPSESAIWTGWAEALALGGRPEDEKTFLVALRDAPLAIARKITLQDRFGAHRAASRRQTGGQDQAEVEALIALMKDRRYPEAEARARAAVARYPQSAVALNVLGGAQAMQGNPEAAKANFAKAAALDPGYAEAQDNLGRILLDQNRLEEALVQFRKAVTLTPYMLSALVNYGACLARLGHATSAIAPLERAVAHAPDPALCLIALGNAHTRARNYAKAEEVLERAVAASKGKSADAYGMLAQAQSRLGKDDVALENYEHALALDPDSPIANGGKASTLQTLGRFDEAEQLFRRVFDLDPTNGENFRSFIASHKTRPGDPVIDMMLERFERKDLNTLDRLNLGFAIAKALEDVKDYDRVFKYLDQANALMRQLFPYDIAQRVREVGQLKTAFAGFDWHGTAIAGTTDFAPIFVTGMPRSGTTLIEQIISCHSRVQGAGEVGKATQQAQTLMVRGDRVRPMAAVDPRAIAELGIEYAAYMRERFTDKPQVSDKSIQTYLYIGLIKLALPQSRIIVVRRDPRDNLLSMYKNKFPDGTHLASYDQRDVAILYDTFVDMVDFWRGIVPDWFYEVDYDALVSDPDPETRKLIAACGLEWEDACLSPQDNDRKVETLSLFQVRQPITKASVKGWKRFEKDLAPMLDELKARGHVTD